MVVENNKMDQATELTITAPVIELQTIFDLARIGADKQVTVIQQTLQAFATRVTAAAEAAQPPAEKPQP